MEKTKVMLITPPMTIPKGYANMAEAQLPSLGIMYIAGLLEKNRFQVRITDALFEGQEIFSPAEGGMVRIGLPDSEISRRLEEYMPSVVGISASYGAYTGDSFRLASLVKAILPDSTVVFGGSQSSAKSREMLSDNNVDIVVFGEAEYTFLELCKKISSGEPLLGVKGLIFKNNSEITENAPREFIKDLDALPFPARHLIPIEKHLHNPRAYPWAMSRPVIEMITSRGCNGHCTFCSIHSVWKHIWRARSAENVLDEMEFLVKKYGVREFSILDDNIGVDKERLGKICDGIIKRDLNVNWGTPNGIAAWTLDRNLLEKMKKSGYYRIKLGIETGSERTMEYIRKQINIGQAKQIIRDCNELGIWTSSSFIIGFPHETIEDIEATIKFAKESDLDFARFLIAQPYSGTELAGDFAKSGLLEGGIKDASSCFITKYATKHLSADKLNKLRVKAENEFLKSRLRKYFYPPNFTKNFWPKISSKKKFAYLLKSLGKFVKNKLLSKYV